MEITKEHADKDSNALYVRITNNKIMYSREMIERASTGKKPAIVVIDFDENAQPVGIEIVYRN